MVCFVSREQTPFHVSILAKQTTRNLGQGSFHPKRYPIKAAKFGQGTRSYIVESVHAPFVPSALPGPSSTNTRQPRSKAVSGKPDHCTVLHT